MRIALVLCVYVVHMVVVDAYTTELEGLERECYWTRAQKGDKIYGTYVSPLTPSACHTLIFAI